MSTDLLLRYYFILLIAAELVLSFLFPQNAWGLSQLRYLTGTQIIFSVVIALTAAAAYVFIHNKRNISDRILKLLGSLGVACILIGFWGFRVQNVFLGDGESFSSFMRGTGYIYPSNIVDFGIHKVIYDLFFASAAYSPLHAYFVVGGVCGLVFILFLCKNINKTAGSRAESLFLWIILFFTGYCVFYFGYVESYAILFLFLQIYLITSLSCMSGSRSCLIPLVSLVFCVILHQVCILLVPSFLYLYYHRSNKAVTLRTNQVIIVLAIMALLSVIGYYCVKQYHWLDGYVSVLKARGVFDFSLFLKPFGSGYAAFSTSHFLDLFNAFMLASPAGLISFPILLLYRDILRDRGIAFLLVAFLLPALFFFFMKSSIGLFFDWDLFALPAVISTVVLFRIFNKHLFGRIGTITVTLIIFASVWHSMNWVLLNHSEDAAAARFLSFLNKNENALTKEHLSYNFEKMANFYLRKDNLEKELEYRKKAFELTRNPRVMNNIAFLYAKKGDLKSELICLEESIQLEPDNRKTMVQIAFVSTSLGDHNKALKYFDGTKELLWDDFNLLSKYGESLLQAGRWADAATVYKRASEVNPADGGCLYDMGYALSMDNRVQEAIVSYKESIKRNKSIPLPYFELATVYLREKDYTQASNFYKEALKLGLPPDSAFEKQLNGQ